MLRTLDDVESSELGVLLDFEPENSNKNYSTFSPSDSESTQAPSYWAWLPDFSSLKRSVTSCLTSSLNTVYSWIPSRYSMINGVFSFITAIPYLPYTMQLYTGTPPEDFTLEWWHDLPLEMQALASSMSVFTFVISVIVHYYYFPDTAKRLLEVLSDWSDKVLVNSITVYLTVATMISAYGLGYDGMIQAGLILAVMTGVINASLCGAFRLAFIPSFINRIKNYFDQDETFKAVCIDYLQQLASPNFIHDYLDGSTLDEQSIRRLFLKLDNELKEGDPGKLFKPINPYKQGARLFDISMGSALFLGYGLFNIQTGYRGMSVISKLIGEDYSIEAWPHWQKALTGASSGLSSGMFAFVLGYDMRQLLLSVYRYLKDHKEELTLNLTILIGIVLSSLADIGPIASPAYNIANDPHNLIFISMDNITGPLFIACASLFSFLLDFSGMKALALNKPQSPSPTLQTRDVIDWIKKAPESTSLMQELKTLGIFAKERQNPSEAISTRATLRF